MDINKYKREDSTIKRTLKPDNDSKNVIAKPSKLELKIKQMANPELVMMKKPSASSQSFGGTPAFRDRVLE